MYSAEQTAKIAQWRAEASAGTINVEQMREAIALLREGRQAAAEASKAAKGRAKAKQKKTSADMLAELGKL